MRTDNIPSYQKQIEKDIPIMLPDYPCLEHIFMVPKVFEVLLYL